MYVFFLIGSPSKTFLAHLYLASLEIIRESAVLPNVNGIVEYYQYR